MTDEELRLIPILNVLPQRPPFILVDRMWHYDDTSIECRTTIRPDGALVGPDGRLSAGGMIENMAQTCAARIGYVNRYILRREVTAGVIGAIRNLTIKRRPQAGETITTRIEILHSAFGLSLVQATISDAQGSLLGEGEMKVVER